MLLLLLVWLGLVGSCCNCIRKGICLRFSVGCELMTSFTFLHAAHKHLEQETWPSFPTPCNYQVRDRQPAVLCLPFSLLLSLHFISFHFISLIIWFDLISLIIWFDFFFFQLLKFVFDYSCFWFDLISLIIWFDLI